MFTVTHPKAGDIDFPDGTSDADVAKAMRQLDVETGISKPKEESPVNSKFSPGLNDQLTDLKKGIIKIPKDEPYGQNNLDKSPKSPDVGESVFPRFAKRTNDPNSTIGQRVNAAGADLLSLPGRTVASGVDAATGGPSMGEGMRDLNGKTTLGKIVRSPATGAAIGATVLTGGAALPLLGSIGTGIGVSALAGAGEQQLENLNQDKPVSGKEFATDAAGGIIGGGLAYGAGKYVVAPVVKGIANKATNIFLNKGVDKLFADLKPTGKMVENGFKKSVLAENEIIGTPSEALAKTQSIIDKHTSDIKNVVSSAVGKNGQEPTVNVIGVISDMSKPGNLQKGFSKEQTAALQDLLERTAEIDPNGQIKITDIPTVKKIIVELRNDFNNPPSGPSDAILGKTYKAIDDAFIGTVDKMGADGAKIKAANTKISELIPIASTIEKKINQGIEEKTPGFIAGTMKKIATPANAAQEFLLHSIGLGGLSTGAKTLGSIADHASPSIAKGLLNVRQQQMARELATEIASGSNKVNGLPPFLNKIFKGQNLSPSDIAELESYYNGVIGNRRIKSMNQANGTLGSIAGQNENLNDSATTGR